ncbi:MAG: extracellular solute-binding protein [Lachnospirales bacterium]
MKAKVIQKKVIAILAVMAMTLSLVSCGGNTGTDTAKKDTTVVESEVQEEKEESTEETKDPNAIDVEAVKREIAETITNMPGAQEGAPVLTVGMQQNTWVEDYDNNFVTKLLEEKNNVDLQFEYLPSSNDDFKTKLTLMVSADQKLPDVLTGILPEMSVYEYGRLGVLQDVTSYYDNSEVMPVVNSFSEADKEFAKKGITQPDGKIYSAPTLMQFQWNEGTFRMWINQEWLDALGLPEPTTTEEFKETLRAFINDDPNGNGMYDEIGLVGAHGGWATDPTTYIMSAFTYANQDKSYLHVEDGKVYASYTKPEFKEGLAYMNELVNEGLLDPMTFTQDLTALKSITTVDEAIAGVVPGGSFSVFNNVGPAAERMTLLGPLTGPNGEKNVAQSPSISQSTWMVTKYCENPELAMKVADSCYSDEVSLNLQQGIEGLNWTMDPEVTSQWTGKYMDEPTYVVYPELSVWNVPGNVLWQAGPRFERWEFRKGVSDLPKDQIGDRKIGNWNKMHLEKYVPYFPKEVITKILSSPEEAARFSELDAALKTHYDVAIVEFITGNRPLSEYDKFLEELNELGFEEYMELVQTGYDRFENN